MMYEGLEFRYSGIVWVVVLILPPLLEFFILLLATNDIFIVVFVWICIILLLMYGTSISILMGCIPEEKIYGLWVAVTKCNIYRPFSLSHLLYSWLTWYTTNLFCSLFTMTYITPLPFLVSLIAMPFSFLGFFCGITLRSYNNSDKSPLLV